MKLILLNISFIFLFFTSTFSQVIYTTPQFPTETDDITVFFDATQPGGEGLLNYSGTVYAHTGVITNLGGTVWQHVIGDWGNNNNQPALTRLGPNLYSLNIGNPRTFYGVSNPSEIIEQLAFVFRSSDANQQTIDLFVDIYSSGLNLLVNNPDIEVKFGDPQRSPAFVKVGETIQIEIEAVVIETEISSITLFVDGTQVAQTSNAILNYNFSHSSYSEGPHSVIAVGIDTSGISDTTEFMMFVNPPVVNAPLPSGIRHGINYVNSTTVTLALFAPYKEFIYVIGQFNDWKVDTDFYMNKHEVNTDSVVWWITLDNIIPGVDRGFQYLVDGTIRTGDPYAELILDPWNDQYIGSLIYPNLPAYPEDKTEGLVATMRTGTSPYPWQVTNFEKPDKEDLVIYELLVRDFLELSTFAVLEDTLNYLKELGVNAIELMPIMEFSGNNSWGYNPVYHTAVDKFYGPANTLKSFIDKCHQNGIAVILDMVLNHTENLSPFAMLWWDDQQNRPAANNPYLNPTAKHPFNVFNDFNHESSATKYFVDRVNEYWVEEFKFDGFRFDLSKGFTQTFSSNVNQWGQYDQSRIDILKRMADKIWETDSTTLVILEHFAANNEETVLSDYGMMLWGNENYQYNEATMGYSSNLTGVSYQARGWNDPHLIAYMESHDEERLMYKNLEYGNSSGNYNIKYLPTALDRIKLAAAFYFTVPGPKMIWQFGELGYDYSINYPCGTEQCRVDPKPVKWDYYDDMRRRNLYKVFQALINIKKEYDVFETDNFTLNVGNYGKVINLNHSSMNATIIGNFSVSSLNVNPNFQNTGWWYDFFSGDSINVTNTQAGISLEPGKFHIYTTVKLPTPEPGILTSVDEQNFETTVKEYSLKQNYPNPFNPTTKISWQSPTGSRQTLKVYDVLGKEVAVLVDEYKPAGSYEVEFSGGNLSSGVYFYKLEAGDFIEIRKMILLK